MSRSRQTRPHPGFRGLRSAMARLRSEVTPWSGVIYRFEAPMYAGANGALKMAHDMPEEYWKKLS